MNPYLAAADDPLSTRQLMLTDRYRVLWLELLPECFFSLRTQCPTTVRPPFQPLLSSSYEP